MRIVTALALALALAVAAAPATAAELLGPFEAELVSCFDGDTCRFDVTVVLEEDLDVWFGQTTRIRVEHRIHTAVRLRGVDTPELHGDCFRERVLAAQARTRLLELLEQAESIELYDVAPDKYGGRVGATVVADGVDVAATLIAERYGRPYDGGARGEWCGEGGP